MQWSLGKYKFTIDIFYNTVFFKTSHPLYYYQTHQKSLNICKLSSSRWIQILSFLLESLILLLETHIVSFFPYSKSLTSFICKKITATSISLSTCGLSVILSNKKEKVAGSSCSSHRNACPHGNHTLICRFPSLSYRILNRYAFKC